MYVLLKYHIHSFSFICNNYLKEPHFYMVVPIYGSILKVKQNYYSIEIPIFLCSICVLTSQYGEISLSDYRKRNTRSVYFMLFLQDKRDNPGFQNLRIKSAIKCESQHTASTDVSIIISPCSLGEG